MHDAFLRIDTDVRLHPEVPLLALPGLMHLRIALFLFVLGRRGRVDDRRVDDRAGRDANAAAG
jgi:hypothetical protein